MRTWTAVFSLLTVAVAHPVMAQQGSVQLSSSAHVVVADAERRAGQPTLDPDFGFTAYQPGFRFGTLFADFHVVRRADSVRIGQTAFGLRDVKLGGLTWSLTGGDSSMSPSLSDYAFTNLFAPQVTFSGGHLAGYAKRGSVTLTAGRVTALRNIFGSDPQGVEQEMGQLQARYRPSASVEVFARASHVLTRDAREFVWFVSRSDDVGGGVRARPIPTVEVTADLGASRYIRRGGTEREQRVNALLGGKWTLRRGWLELNAHRFSPGYFPVLNTPYLDREGAYAAGEVEATSRLRIYGGFEAFRTNPDPVGSTEIVASLPQGVSNRGFAGVRLHVTGGTFLSIRAEDGDRTSRPVRLPGANLDSDTGVVSVEMQTAAKTLTGFGRYEWRENVDHANNGNGTYGQHTGSAQISKRVNERLQVFGSAMLIRQARQTGGLTFLQAGGGAQWQLPARPLWLRGEGLFTRSDDWESDTVLPHQLFTVGLTGQLSARTSMSFDVMLDRAPQQNVATNPWLARSMIRLLHSLPTGSARVAPSPGVSTRRSRGSLGSIGGLAYADWNGNGAREEGEEPLPGVPFVLSAADPAGTEDTRVTTGPAGEFAFTSVPQGRARVGLDLAALPVDYDPPQTTSVDTEVRDRRGDKLAFGLVPLGSIAGKVVQDADGDGRDSAADSPVDGAVLLLDRGERSEQTRGGAFHFDSVRAGAHTVTLLRESIGEGATLTGDPNVDVVLDRARLRATVTFVVRVEKRPEIRRVFPSKSISQNGNEPSRGTAGSNPGVPASRATARAVRTAARASAARGASGDASFAIQLAAIHDRARGRQLVTKLQHRGVDAYLYEDTDGLAKVRVGSYRTRAAAEPELRRLKHMRLTGWIATIGR
jgi:cell division septation protein DedD